MNKQLLRKHLADYFQKQKKNPQAFTNDTNERLERTRYYQGWTTERLLKINPDEIYEFLSKLWAMRIWGNKHYVVDKLLQEHTVTEVGEELATLLWSDLPLEERWDSFRNKITGIGPAMMSELLCHAHPADCVLWNRRAYVGFKYLGVEGLPRYNYQLTGAKYESLCEAAKEIAREMQTCGDRGANLLSVDYFLWAELQVEENLNQIHKPISKSEEAPPVVEKVDAVTAEFIHDEVRDKIAEIGQWLGMQSQTEVKVADGAKVDAIWQATIGNMGRVIYVFEVQTKGSIDSLILNLLKSLNNPAVQGVVAVSDSIQLKKIEAESTGVPGLKGKLKCWDYKQVLDVHEALEAVNETINSLGLVPQGF